MSPSAETRTIGVTIRRPADAVYDYLAAIENFPRWSAFARTVRREGDDWIFGTSGGDARVRFAPRNAFRVLDHHVTTPDGHIVFVPFRVVPNGADHAEVLFTVFRMPGMTGQQFTDDVALVQADLTNLKRVLEN